MLKYNLFLKWKSEFSVSLLQSSENILKWWFAAQEIFPIIIINVENSCAASYFGVYFFFPKCFL